MTGGEKKRKSNLRNVQEPAVLPEEFSEEIKNTAYGRPVTPATLVMEKVLLEADLTNKFCIPMDQILRDDFLTDKQKRLLENNNFIGVKILGPSPTVIDNVNVAHFRRLENAGNTSSCYAITGSWANISRGLTKGTKVQLWSYRVGGELFFALVCPNKDY